MGRVLEPFQQWLSRPFPAVNVDDLGDRYLVTADLPGLSRADIDLTVAGSVLTLCGDRPLPAEFVAGTYLRQERPRGPWNRSISLPGACDGGTARASVHRGVLTVLLPKAEATGPQTVPIRSGPD